MRRPITYLNVALLLLAVWLAANIRVSWGRNHTRYALFAASTTGGSRAAEARAVASGATPAPAPAGYTEVVTQNLFSSDRNNEQPASKAQKKPPPPVPVVIGTVSLASGLVALMADREQAARGTFRRVKVGDEIGGYRVVQIAEHKVVIEFEGQKTTIDVYESAELVRDAAGVAPAPSAPAVVPQVVTAVSAGTGTESPGPQTVPNTPASETAKPGTSIPTGDPYYTITIEGNRRKHTRITPFGNQVWYDEIKPAPKPQ